MAQLLSFRPLIDGYFDGVVFATATLDSQTVPELQRRGVPRVLVVRSVDSVQVDMVEIDNFRAGVEAARYLYELGHRRIGLARGLYNTSTSRDRARGVSSFLESVKRPASRAGHLQHREWLRVHGPLLAWADPPSASIADNDTIALAVLEAAALSGVEFRNFVAALFLLGLGWNFLFTGATTLAPHGLPLRRKGQGAGRFEFLRLRGAGLLALGQRGPRKA